MNTFSDTAVHTQGVGFGLVVSYDKKCIGVVTDGDLRRYLSEPCLHFPEDVLVFVGNVIVFHVLSAIILYIRLCSVVVRRF